MKSPKVKVPVDGEKNMGVILCDLVVGHISRYRRGYNNELGKSAPIVEDGK